ncbi:MAG TPA: FAD-dependent oxidoreductase [Gaiellaceae bacterium]|nr:FAD-dependent oxidoreductase [Gaiellaceae bacterium]
MRVAVVGAGIMGLAAADALARRGHDVDVHEQFEIDHARGSSHGRSRIFRLSYPGAEWVRLAQEAYAGWRELERVTGEELLVLNGLLEFGETSEAALDACGVEWSPVEPDELERRFGVRANERALLQPEAGYVRADRARRAFLARGGFTLREKSPVTSIESVDAEVVVVTAGSWAPKLLAAAGIELDVRVTRETVAYFALDDERVPSIIEYRRGPTPSVYALHDPVHGLKAGVHMAGEEVDPDVPTAADPGLVDAVAAWVAERYVHADTTPAAVDTCMYTTTHDETFVLERHGRIVVGSACSGHGFKFAPAVGERLAALATA